MTALQQTPAADEFELSLFGPGVGECAVVHLGNGDWIVVDSCRDRATGNPVALDYLGQLGVNPAEAVRLIVVSHWHDDHIRGIAEVARAAPAAEIVCSAALRRKEFIDALPADDLPYMRNAGVSEMREIFDLLYERTSGRPSDATPRWALADTRLYHSPTSTVEALSPSNATFTRALHEIAMLMPGAGETALRAIKNSPNEIAVAIWIESGGIRAILGSDLERGDAPTTGWQAIVNSALRPPAKAHVLKVPHHGSAGAHEDRVWAELLEPNPVAVLTPYRRSLLPRDTDESRIASKAGSAYCTAPARRPRPERRQQTVEKIIRRVAPDLRVVVGAMGHVRIRAAMGFPEPVVEMFGPAYKL